MTTLTVSLAQGELLLDGLLRQGSAVSHDCGGVLACVSCQVVVHEGLGRLSPASDDELDLLERAGATAPGARLACQAAGEGEVVVEIPRLQAPAHEKTLPLAVTEQAAAHLAAQLAKHPGAVAVRLAVRPAGCSGFKYAVDSAEAMLPGDAVFEARGVRIAVDPESLPFLQGAVVDLVQEGLARRLRFDNPNATQSCGCGESFGT